VMGYRSYPFFGSRRQFRVVRPRRVTSQDGLDGYLRQHQVGIIAAIGRYRPTFPKYTDVDKWLSENTETFDPMDVSGGRFFVYRVRGGGRAASDASTSGRTARPAGQPVDAGPKKAPREGEQ